jgi:DNA-binding response OmpR family regulator
VTLFTGVVDGVSFQPELDPPSTIVVCEDDAPTLELLCDHLEADRYRARPAPSASDALRLCHYKQPDLLLLDLRLPDAFGLEVLREVRASEGATGRYDPELPVIILSGRGSEADRMRGFVEGADDYVVKPFHYPELLARVRAVLWRRAGRRQGPLRVGEIVVDTARREVRVAGRPVKLANKEFARMPLVHAANRVRGQQSGNFKAGVFPPFAVDSGGFGQPPPCAWAVSMMGS